MSEYRGKFSPLMEKNPKKRLRRSTGSMSATDDIVNTPPIPSQTKFATMDPNEKMNSMYDMMLNSFNLQLNVRDMTESMYHVSARCDITESRLRLLEYKSIDMEAKMLRNNLIFTGLVEVPNSDDCVSIIRKLLVENLNINPESITITRAHRIGKIQAVRARGVTRPRPILVSFRDPAEADRIMDNARLLAQTNYGISRDYPREISDARKALWPEFKEARARFGARNVKIQFPAALVINGDVVRNHFPGWFDTLRGSRNTNVQARIQERFSRTVSESLNAQSKSVTERHNPEPAITQLDSSSEDEGSNTEPMDDRPPKPTPTVEDPVKPVGPQQQAPAATAAKTTPAGYLLKVHPPLGASQQAVSEPKEPGNSVDPPSASVPPTDGQSV